MIEWLRKWYESNCDGDWEHCYGIRIDTLDNPGWRVDIDLTDTNLEDVYFNEIRMYIDEHNWISCNVTDGIFKGRGSIDKLEKILKIFSEWADKNES